MSTENGLLSSLSLVALERIDSRCTAFEKELNSNPGLQIEDFLDLKCENENEVLLREMLVLEIDHRKSQGLAATQIEYETRFSEFSHVVRDIFEESNGCGLEEQRRDYSGELISERFHVRSLLGSGAFSDVYLADDLERGEPIALKVLNPNQGVDVETLLGEAKMLAGLEHPNIVSAYDWGTVDGVAFIALQYVDGQTLAGKIANHTENDATVDVDEVVRLSAKICDALQFAHQHGLTHRDIKPQNILIDSSGRLLVADFGFALHESTQDQHFGDRSGTPYYRAPEQVRGEADWIEGRADIWALGVVMYEMLTGRRPFKGSTIEEIDRQILRRSPKPPRQINTDIPEWLEAITLKCLSPPPSDRYATAAELADALRNQTHPAKHLRLSRKLIMVGAISLLGLGLAALALGIFATDQHSARIDAEIQSEVAANQSLQVIEGTIRNVQQSLKKMSGPGNEAARRFIMRKCIEEVDAVPSTRRQADFLRTKSRLDLVDSLINEQGAENFNESETLLRDCLAILGPWIERAESESKQPPLLRLSGDIQDRFGQIDYLKRQDGLALTHFNQALSNRKKALAILEKDPNADSIVVFMRAARNASPGIDTITDSDLAHREVAKSFLRIGQLHRRGQRHEPALECFRAMVVERQAFFDAHPTNPRAKRDYAGALKDVGSVLAPLGNYVEAERLYRDSIELVREVISDAPKEPDKFDLYPPMVNLGVYLRNLGEIQMRSGRTRAAAETFDKAIAQLDKTQLQFGHSPIKLRTIQTWLGECHYWRGVQLILEDSKNATASFEASAATSNDIIKFFSLARLHKRDEARQAIALAESSIPLKIDELLDRGILFAVCAWSALEEQQLEEYASCRDRAIGLLLKALEGGVSPILIRDDPQLRFLQNDSAYEKQILTAL